jgi:4-azaleucine resistance transporter AzlC
MLLKAGRSLTTRPVPRRYAEGVRAVAPLTVAVAAFGISFGVLARSAGMDRLATLVMSATTFAGSAQFAAASILGAGGGLAAAVAAAVLLNLRYAPIGLSTAPALAGSRWRRLVESQLVVDESWAIAQRDGGMDRHLLIGAGATLWCAWVGGTAVGLLAGNLVADPERLGLDAAFPALFLALVVPQLRTRTRLAAALAGAGLAVVLTPLTGPGVPVVAASLACLVGVRRR